MNELTAAVAIAQLDKLDDMCKKRHEYGEKLNAALQGIKGIYPHKIQDGCSSSYWFYMIRVNEKELGASRDEFTKALVAEGILAAAGYIPCCVYQYDMFKNRTVYPGNTAYPFDGTHGAPIEYKSGDCPIAEQILKTCIKLVVNEFHNDQDLADTVTAIKKVCAYFAK